MADLSEESIRAIIREELEHVADLYGGPLAVKLSDAPELTGYGETTIRLAAQRNELVVKYANSKGVVLRSELLRWLRTLPDEPR